MCSVPAHMEMWGTWLHRLPRLKLTDSLANQPPLGEVWLTQAGR